MNLRGNGSGNKAFSVAITCVEIVFCLVTFVNNKIWLPEFYPRKGEKPLSAEMEIVSTDRALALWRDEINDREHEEIRRLCSSFIKKIHKFLKRYF